jgi:hypothetical protein
MGTKEDVGRVAKKVARILPGIGSYQDKEAARQADKELRIRICGRLDMLLGSVESLKTEVAKRGEYRNLGGLEDLSRHLEKLSRWLRFASGGYAPVFSETKVDEDALNTLYEYDLDLCEIVAMVESAVKMAIEDKKVVPSRDSIDQIRKHLWSMEEKLRYRQSSFK